MPSAPLPFTAHRSGPSLGFSEFSTLYVFPNKFNILVDSDYVQTMRKLASIPVYGAIFHLRFPGSVLPKPLELALQHVPPHRLLPLPPPVHREPSAGATLSSLPERKQVQHHESGA